MEYKTITLIQPWAQFIMLGWKTIETRTHNKFQKLVGQTILIHAGKSWDHNWGFSEEFLTEAQIEKIMLMPILKPQILCSVHVDSFRPLTKEDSFKAIIDCHNYQRFGLFLSNLKLIKPIQINGQLGAWTYNGKVEYL